MRPWLHAVGDVTGALADVPDLTDVSGADRDSCAGPTVRHGADQLPSERKHTQTLIHCLTSQPPSAPSLYLTCSSAARRPPPCSGRCFHCALLPRRHAPSPWRRRLRPSVWSAPPHTPSGSSWGRSARRSSAENYRRNHLRTNGSIVRALLSSKLTRSNEILIFTNNVEASVELTDSVSSAPLPHFSHICPFVEMRVEPFHAGQRRDAVVPPDRVHITLIRSTHDTSVGSCQNATPSVIYNNIIK